MSEAKQLIFEQWINWDGDKNNPHAGFIFYSHLQKKLRTVLILDAAVIHINE